MIQQDAQFTVDSQTIEGVCTLVVRGEVDLASADTLAAALEAAQQSDAERILLDFSDVAFLDSSGIRVMLAAMKYSREHGGRLRMSGGYTSQVQRVLEVTGVIDSLPHV